MTFASQYLTDPRKRRPIDVIIIEKRTLYYLPQMTGMSFAAAPASIWIGVDLLITHFIAVLSDDAFDGVFAQAATAKNSIEAQRPASEGPAFTKELNALLRALIRVVNSGTLGTRGTASEIPSACPSAAGGNLSATVANFLDASAV